MKSIQKYTLLSLTLLCTATIHGMTHRRASTSSSTAITAPASSSSPYEEVLTLERQLLACEETISNKKNEWYNEDPCKCLKNPTAALIVTASTPVTCAAFAYLCPSSKYGIHGVLGEAGLGCATLDISLTAFYFLWLIKGPAIKTLPEKEERDRLQKQITESRRNIIGNSGTTEGRKTTFLLAKKDDTNQD